MLDFIFNSCQTYGISTVLVGVLLFMILVVFMTLFKHAQVKKAVENCYNSINHKINIKKTTAQSLIINSAMDAIISRYNIGRVSIFEYHNGSTNLAGVPFAKVSCTHERLDIGVKSFGSYCQNIPVGLLAWWNNKIVERNFIDMKTEDIKDYNFTQMLSHRKTRRIFSMAIVDFEGNIIGFISAEVCNDFEGNINPESIRAAMMKLCGILLSYNSER
jgi:hypothetical protein